MRGSGQLARMATAMIPWLAAHACSSDVARALTGKKPKRLAASTPPAQPVWSGPARWGRPGGGGLWVMLRVGLWARLCMLFNMHA